jgi:hypothetical protein
VTFSERSEEKVYEETGEIESPFDITLSKRFFSRRIVPDNFVNVVNQYLNVSQNSATISGGKGYF